MGARVISTIAAVLMAAGAFWGAGPTEGGLLDPFAILFLLVAILTWYEWDLIEDGFSTGPMDFMFVRAALFLKNKVQPKAPD